jgi:hypothetical protein
MRTIIRCPNCFTYVYQDARACHGCGERIGRRKILRTGSWVFIGLAVSAFTVARAIDLEQEKQWRDRKEADRSETVTAALHFVRAWLTDDAQYLSTLANNDDVFVGDLARVRARYPSVLPADTLVSGIRFSDIGSKDHYQYERGKEVLHLPKTQYDGSAPGRASAIPKLRGNAPYRRPPRVWKVETYEFEAEVTKGDAHYTVYGEICAEEHKVICLTIDKIVGVEGVITPKE